jgi:mono/diheme cytochrome c family protein
MSGTSISAIGAAILLAALPFALIGRSRQETSTLPALHLIQNMAKEPKFQPQSPTPLFADGRAMRPQIPGTLAREDLISQVQAADGIPHALIATLPQAIASEDLQNRILLGQFKDASGQPQWVTTLPIPVNDQLMQRGQRQFEIYCTHCHGYSGYGDGMVAQIARQLQADHAGPGEALAWVNPASLHDPRIRRQPVGEIFNTITNGIRTMPEHGPQIRVLDRWAIAAYVKALQKSQYNSFNDLTPAEKQRVLQTENDGSNQ